MLAEAVLTHIMLLGPSKFSKVSTETVLRDIVGPKTSAIFTIFKLNANWLKYPFQNGKTQLIIKKPNAFLIFENHQ